MSFRLVTPQKPALLPDAPVKGIILHWTAGRYGQRFDDYHFSLDAGGAVYQNKECPPGVWTSHCWRRNTGNIGIAVEAMYGATTEDAGDYPVTRCQIESMAALVAKLMRRYSIPIERVMTHAEAADLDGYGPATTCERWDLLGRGPEIRKKALWYLKQ